MTVDELCARLANIQARIAAAARSAGRDPATITLVAATKTRSGATVRTAIAAGVTACGENRVQELVSKLDEFAYDGASLHFIGRLQTNKVKYLVGRVDLIQSVDSPRLLEAISRRAVALGTVQDILLQVNLGDEASKGGLSPELVLPLAGAAAVAPGVRLRGLMCIPPPAQAPGGNRPFFAAARQLFVDMQREVGDNKSDIHCLSMGMSDDFEDAAAEGSTLVRVGTALFGPRHTTV